MVATLPARDAANAEQAAAVVAFLASEETIFIYGGAMHTDGGRVAVWSSANEPSRDARRPVRVRKRIPVDPNKACPPSDRRSRDGCDSWSACPLGGKAGQGRGSRGLPRKRPRDRRRRAGHRDVVRVQARGIP